MVSKRFTSGARKRLIRQDEQTRKEMRLEMQTFVDLMEIQYKQVISKWRHKPKFKKVIKIRPGYIVASCLLTGDDAKIFAYVDEGTKPHVIAAKPSNPTGRLKFQTNYSHLTAPTARINQGTGKASGPWRSPQVVFHPGTKAREFTKTFLDELNPPFAKRIENAIRRGLYRANK